MVTALSVSLQQLWSGAGLWDMILAYMLVGMGVTFLGAGLLTWRAWGADRVRPRVVLRGAVP